MVEEVIGHASNPIPAWKFSVHMKCSLNW